MLNLFLGMIPNVSRLGEKKMKKEKIIENYCSPPPSISLVRNFTIMKNNNLKCNILSQYSDFFKTIAKF